MNYLAHGFRHTSDPWFLAGTAAPDWLRMIDRRLRISRERAAAAADDPDPRVADLARGVLRHLAEDAAFHSSEAFHDATSALGALVRTAVRVVPDGDPRVLRPSFVAHLLVETLLDAEIMRDDPGALDRYYAAVASIDADEIQSVAAHVTPIPPAGLADLVRRFVASRFVADYADDARLLRRIDAVFRRLRQPEVSPFLLPTMPEARRIVREHAVALLVPSG
ncbi:MAG: hypothetical protein K8T90_05555 [Planctomycetes bacterium]|nr:hypothetical protein [Planctomycetota bacterium]